MALMELMALMAQGEKTPRHKIEAFISLLFSGSQNGTKFD